MKSTGKETSGCEKKAIESIPSKSYCKATVKKHKGVKKKKHRATTTEAVEISTSLCTFSQSRIQIKIVIWVSHNNNNNLKEA